MDNIDKEFEEHEKRRREFLAKTAKVAVTVPAVSLLITHSNAVDAGFIAVSGCDPDPSNDFCGEDQP